MHREWARLRSSSPYKLRQHIQRVDTGFIRLRWAGGAKIPRELATNCGEPFFSSPFRDSVLAIILRAKCTTANFTSWPRKRPKGCLRVGVAKAPAKAIGYKVRAQYEVCVYVAKLQRSIANSIFETPGSSKGGSSNHRPCCLCAYVSMSHDCALTCEDREREREKRECAVVAKCQHNWIRATRGER